jgi:hypothetical protein
VSELLDRIEKEIRERLAATRDAMVEHERLQAALHALTGAGEDAARAVKARATGRGSAKPASGRTAPSSSPARTGTGDQTTTPAKPRAKRSRTATPAPSARKRAPRGANREVVLSTVADRPGVTSGELADATGIKRATLSTLLGKLTKSGELERHEQPSGLQGYSLARSTQANDAPTGGSEERVSAPAATGEGDAPTAGQRAETLGTSSSDEEASTDTATEDPAAPNSSEGA